MFKSFKQRLQESFKKLVKDQVVLFSTNIDRDALWNTYLNSFPEEDRQGYNCSCCRSFIKNYGHVVAIVGEKIVSIWDFDGNVSPEFKNVATAMNDLVLSSDITNVFYSKTKHAGTDKNKQLTDNHYITWEHLYLELPNQFVNNSSLSIEALQGRQRDNRNVFKRSLDEITIDALETVLELIGQNSLYRGQEFKGAIEEFLKYRKEYDKTSNKENYAWKFANTLPASIAKIRGTAIGTLLVDISNGRELDQSVTAFERMVAPTNYKRTSTIVTKGMVEQAEKKIIELGLTESLGRRFATKDDISIVNLLFANRDSSKEMSIFDEMKEDALFNPRSFNKTEEIGIDDFIKNVLPTCKGIEVLVENSHMNNFMTMITAKKPESPGLFKWNNPFSWSYTNGNTDSIKELVKAAGGNVVGELRVSLSWFNYDDLDLHLIEPSGNKIFYGSKLNAHTKGNLDVDMNAGSGTSRTPVENIIFPNKTTMLEGTYKVIVNNYNLREQSNSGFIVEIEQNGEVFTFEQAVSPRHDQSVTIAEFTYSKKDGIKFVGDVKTNTLSKEKWNLGTNKFHKVSMIMNSPNYWQEETGNKHTFFILENCKTDETPRGFFNEFLKNEFMENKYVFDALGSRLKVEPSTEEVSGIGFSSTQRNHLICRVTGKFQRILKVNF